LTNHKLISTDTNERLIELSTELAEVYDNGKLGTKKVLLNLANFCISIGQQIKDDIILYQHEKEH